MAGWLLTPLERLEAMQLESNALSCGRNAMVIETGRKLFTVDEYHRMLEAGILRESDRVELIDGEILEMSAIGYRHWVNVNRMTALFTESFGRRALVSIQNSLRLDDWTEPEPDVVVFRGRDDFYVGS